MQVAERLLTRKDLINDADHVPGLFKWKVKMICLFLFFAIRLFALVTNQESAKCWQEVMEGIFNKGRNVSQKDELMGKHPTNRASALWSWHNWTFHQFVVEVS